MINDRQFFISQQENELLTNWGKIKLQFGYQLFYHPELRIFKSHSGRFLILGHVWQVDSSRKSPEEELESLETKKNICHEDVYEIEKTWCGRYVLIVNEWIYLDATGSLGVFFNNILASSSLNLICSIEKRQYIEPGFQYRVSPDYFPGIHTPYPGINRLMPSQILNYKTKEVINRPLLIDNIPSQKDEKELIEIFSNYFVHSAQNLARHFSDQKIWFALSAGRDSRTALALFDKAGIDFACFTLQHDWISLPDKVIPQYLAKAINRPYRYIKRCKSNYSQQRYDDYKTHTAGMSKDADWLFYAYNQYQTLKKAGEKIVLIRSGIWETPEEFYTVAYGEKSKDINTLFPGILSNNIQYKSTYDWYEMAQKDNKNTNIPFECRIVWEMSQGCWLSSIEQSFDLMEGITSIQPLNCRLFLGLLLGFNVDDRHQKLHEEKITVSNCPSFASIPYDYQYKPTFLQRVSRKLEKIAKKFKCESAY